jgi:hypothetical protein
MTFTCSHLGARLAAVTDWWEVRGGGERGLRVAAGNNRGLEVIFQRSEASQGVRPSTRLTSGAVCPAEGPLLARCPTPSEASGSRASSSAGLLFSPVEGSIPARCWVHLTPNGGPAWKLRPAQTATQASPLPRPGGRGHGGPSVRITAVRCSRAPPFIAPIRHLSSKIAGPPPPGAKRVA